MFEKLVDIEKHFNKLSQEISDPSIFSDNKLYQTKVKEYHSLMPLMTGYNHWLAHKEKLAQLENDIKLECDPDIIPLYEDEINNQKALIKQTEEEIKLQLLPKDENDEKNIILEIRAGVGGEESALFAADLLRMYSMYCQLNNFEIELLNVEYTQIEGIKEAQARITGKNVYAKFKYESGVHRVQRIPETESQGRVHTSAATVAVLPEMEDTDVEINDKDIRIDLFRSSGAGGQHINKTESAIRITHFPTGIVVTCQDCRSQLQNKERAFAVLRSKLYDYYQSQKDAEYRENRKSQVGSGDRSERIRTYNFPQGRVTDHRIGFSLYNMDNVMNGHIEEFVEKLAIAEQQEKLSK